ncbi:MAG: NAD(P)H-dependent glycerol-3-phosphate dehydrogenase [Anaerolineaceae bacterium]
MPDFVVCGATSWGVTLASVLSLSHERVILLTRSSAEAESVRERRGIARLPEVSLSSRVTIVAEPPPPQSVQGMVLAVPAQSLRTAAGCFLGYEGVPVLSAAKGIELATGRRMSEVLAEKWPLQQIAVLSGPNLAHEVGRGLPAAAVVASAGAETAIAWQQALATASFRLYTSSDVVGVELAGALKNVVAIAAGAAVGLNLGANAVAAIVTRGLAEITRLGLALGADAATFSGLAGVGDLTVTCFSPLSRNHRLGELLAAGVSASAALAQIGEAVEGAATAGVALELAARAGVELPIAREVAAVLAGKRKVSEAMSLLLTRPLGPESPSVSQ